MGVAGGEGGGKGWEVRGGVVGASGGARVGGSYWGMGVVDGTWRRGKERRDGVGEG